MVTIITAILPIFLVLLFLVTVISFALFIKRTVERQKELLRRVTVMESKLDELLKK